MLYYMFYPPPCRRQRAPCLGCVVLHYPHYTTYTVLLTLYFRGTPPQHAPIHFLGQKLSTFTDAPQNPKKTVFRDFWAPAGTPK